MKKIICMLLLVGAAGCQQAAPGYDAASGAAFRAAWNKRRAGDEAGYRAALADLARNRHTWAGQRAAQDLEIIDDRQGDSMFGRLVQRAAELVGAPGSIDRAAVGPAFQH